MNSKLIYTNRASVVFKCYTCMYILSDVITTVVGKSTRNYLAYLTLKYNKVSFVTYVKPSYPK